MTEIKTILYNNQDVKNISVTKDGDTDNLDTLIYNADYIWHPAGATPPDEKQEADTSDVYLVGIDADGLILSKASNTEQRAVFNGPATMLVKANGNVNIVPYGDMTYNYIDGLGYIVSTIMDEWEYERTGELAWVGVGAVDINNREYKIMRDIGDSTHKFLIDTEYTSKVIKLPSTGGTVTVRLNFYMNGFDDVKYTAPSAIGIVNQETGALTTLYQYSNVQSLTNGIFTQYPTISLMQGNSSVYEITFTYSSNTSSSNYRDVLLDVETIEDNNIVGNLGLHFVQEPANQNRVYYSTRNGLLTVNGLQENNSLVTLPYGDDITKAPYILYDRTYISPNSGELENNSPVNTPYDEYKYGYGLFHIGNVQVETESGIHVAPGRFIAIPASWQVNYTFNPSFNVNGYQPQTTDPNADGYWTAPTVTWGNTLYAIYDTEEIYKDLTYIVP